MIRALLDHPWALDATLEAGSPGFGVLRRFDILVKTYALEPVHFIGQAEYEQVWLRIDYGRHVRSSGLVNLRRIASQLLRGADGRCGATPNPPPANLSEDWKCALREAAVVDWRNPQIVVAGARSQEWP